MLKVILVTGGFDPVHSGHIELFKNAKEIDPNVSLCVGLNSDDWLVRKKGKYFMPFDERKSVIEELKSVDLVIPFDDIVSTTASTFLAVEIPTLE
jgi:D-beta-D-heptose 7-phosphate kinase/D-beta-D-heptose 1-phosphate adenosyltransferase